ncbi:MAG TPA: dTMP kinase [Jatrophihabitantaceae bacterium]|nr:dTMP kinase [Jatrophihabitantaceae bacterium]
MPPPPSSVSTVAAIRGVLRVTSFRRLWYSTALSSLGDWLGLLATTALATSLTHGYKAQNYALGGVLVVKLLPAILLGPLAGVFADRFDRRKTMVISDFVRFVFFLSIPLAHLWVDERGTLVWLLVMSFLIECVSLFWMPAKDASVPNLVRRDQIEPANQLSLITTYGVTPVLGAGLFSVLALITNVLARHLQFFEAQPVNLALYFNAGTFLFGAIVVYFIPEIGGHRSAVPKDEQPSLLFLAREGADFIRHSRLLGGLIIGLVGAFVAAGAVIGAGKIFVASLGGGNAAYGVLFGSVFVGLGCGMAFGPKVARDLSRRRLFGLSLVFAAICLILTAIMPQVVLAMVFVLGVGFGAGVAYLAGTTLMGTDVDNEMRGRVFALLQSLIRVVLIVALAAVPFAVAQVGERTLTVGHVHYTVDGTRIVLIVGGIFALLSGLFAYRKMDDREQVGVWSDVKASIRGDASARRRMREGGVFVAFEGGEGSGKSTQITLLADSLRANGHDVVVTHEPGATEIGGGIRELVLHHRQPLSPRAEALLFAADRAHHVDTIVRPALEAGQVVLTDRYIDSSLAYQGVGRGLTIDEIRRISRFATKDLTADLTVLLDVPARIGLARARGEGTGDKLESESLQFHERVREAFLRLAEVEPRYYKVVDATRPAGEVAAEVGAAVAHLLPPGRVPSPVDVTS